AAPVCDGTCPAGYACTTGDAGGIEPDWRVTICHAGSASEDTMTVAANSAPGFLAGDDTLGPCGVSSSEVATNDGSANVGTAETLVTSSSGAGGSNGSASAESNFTAEPCSCQPIVIATTTTSTSTTNTLPPPPADDADNDGIVDEADPCPNQPRNQCF